MAYLKNISSDRNAPIGTIPLRWGFCPSSGRAELFFKLDMKRAKKRAH